MSTVTLDATGLADKLKIHPDTAKDLLARGEIPAAKIGRAWVVRETDVMDYLERQIMEQTGALLAGRSPKRVRQRARA